MPSTVQAKSWEDFLFAGLYRTPHVSDLGLSWIKTPPHLLKTFIANTVVKIQELAVNFSWYHIFSENNPADIEFRGLNVCVSDLINSPLWWKGPDPSIFTNDELSENIKDSEVKKEFEIPPSKNAVPKSEFSNEIKTLLRGKPDGRSSKSSSALNSLCSVDENNIIEDEIEKLAYQLNEEAERTERPIRRLSKVMYGSTCVDMQVDVMGECLSSIKHVVGLEEGRSLTSVAAEFGIAHSIDSRLWRQFQTTGTAIRGFSRGRPRGTTPADDRYIVLQARRNRRQTAGEIARHTTQATGRPISRFTVARRLHGGGLFARRPRDNEWGRVLFTDESRFSLSSDSHRILIWRERGSRNHPSNIIERDRYGGRGVLVWGGIMLGSRTDLHIFEAGSVNGTRYCNEILLPYVRLFRGAMGLQFLFMDDNAPCHRTVAAEQLLESRRLAARTLPPVTIRELRLALQDEWAAMPQQLIDTLILSMDIRCETCPAVREIISPTKDRMFLAGHPSQGFSAFSRIALHATFQSSFFYPSDFSFIEGYLVSSGTEPRTFGLESDALTTRLPKAQTVL
ncbi:transposable element Tcb2 transposase [Trichonephila clavipes]|nr:transposable element Tcb2 transposase [Trichonephila clavipes]